MQLFLFFRTDLEDVVSLETCVALKADPSKDSCRVEFKVKNTEKIARIAVVSEASVLEFFKQSGEYATTVFADFIDEFQDHAVYFAEAKIHPPSSEASIKVNQIFYIILHFLCYTFFNYDSVFTIFSLQEQKARALLCGYTE